MKRLFLLIAVCIIGMMLPQGMWAAEVYSSETLTITTSEDGKTVTIVSQQAGALWALLEKGRPGDKDPVINAIKAVTGEGSKIVFSGEFSGDDLQSLSKPGPNNCCVQETVDMANTVFKKHIDLEEAMDAYRINTKDVHGQPHLTVSERLNAAAGKIHNFSLQDGDIGVHNGAFYKYDSSTDQWSETNEPFFVSKERMETCIDAGNAREKYAGAMVNGNPTMFQYKQDPADYQDKWMELTSDHAYDEMTFKYWGSYVKTAISSYNAGSDVIAKDLCNACSNLTDLTIGSGTVHSITYNDNKPPLTDLTIGNKVAKLGNGNDGVFADYSSITNLSFETGGNDPLIIDKNCFIRCRGISNELIIPARTTLIEQNAFTNLDALTTITFEETETEKPALIIKREAFNNISNVSRVNVNIDPSKKMMICEYNAFDYNELVAQTDPSGKSAVLHFPEEFFDFYAGNWKRNMTFDQSNLNQIKDGIQVSRTLNGVTYVGGPTQNQLLIEGGFTQIDTNETNGKLDGYYHASGYPNTMYAPANGWQQFARTDTGIDIVIKKGKYFRTYSTENAQAKPEWMTIYRVTNFSDGFKENSNPSSRTEADAATKAATVQEIVVSETGGNSLIPANTGVIRVDEVEKDALYYFMDWSFTGLDYEDTWGFPHNETVNDTKVNFMVPTNDEEATQFGPVDKNASGEITHRNFVLTADAVFMRAKPLTMAANRAYLKLPASMFHWKDESTGSSQGATEGSTASQYSKISLLFFDDFEEVNGGIATEIINAIEEDMYKSDSFYTIQGVKVSKPTTKGVYIRNGKKVFIK